MRGDASKGGGRLDPLRDFEVQRAIALARARESYPVLPRETLVRYCDAAWEAARRADPQGRDLLGAFDRALLTIAWTHRRSGGRVPLEELVEQTIPRIALQPFMVEPVVGDVEEARAAGKPVPAEPPRRPVWRRPPRRIPFTSPLPVGAAVAAGAIGITLLHETHVLPIAPLEQSSNDDVDTSDGRQARPVSESDPAPAIGAPLASIGQKAAGGALFAAPQSDRPGSASAAGTGAGAGASRDAASAAASSGGAAAPSSGAGSSAETAATAPVAASTPEAETAVPQAPVEPIEAPAPAPRPVVTIEMPEPKMVLGFVAPPRLEPTPKESDESDEPTEPEEPSEGFEPGEPVDDQGDGGVESGELPADDDDESDGDRPDAGDDVRDDGGEGDEEEDADRREADGGGTVDHRGDNRWRGYRPREEVEQAELDDSNSQTPSEEAPGEPVPATPERAPSASPPTAPSTTPPAPPSTPPAPAAPATPPAPAAPASPPSAAPAAPPPAPAAPSEPPPAAASPPSGA